MKNSLNYLLRWKQNPFIKKFNNNIISRSKLNYKCDVFSVLVLEVVILIYFKKIQINLFSIVLGCTKICIIRNILLLKAIILHMSRTKDSFINPSIILDVIFLFKCKSEKIFSLKRKEKIMHIHIYFLK